jgi:hypothetical protein
MSAQHLPHRRWLANDSSAPAAQEQEHTTRSASLQLLQQSATPCNNPKAFTFSLLGGGVFSRVIEMTLQGGVQAAAQKDMKAVAQLQSQVAVFGWEYDDEELSSGVMMVCSDDYHCACADNSVCKVRCLCMPRL